MKVLGWEIVRFFKKPELSNNVSVYEAPEAGAEKVETIAPDTTSTESALAGV